MFQPFLDPDVALCLYRVVQEGLRNIAKQSIEEISPIFTGNMGS